MSKKNISSRALSRLQAAATPTGCTRPDSLFGVWSIEPQRFAELVATAKGVDLVALAESRRAQAKADGSPAGPLPTLRPETPGRKKQSADDMGGDNEADDSGDDPNEMDSVDDDPPYSNVNGIAVFSVTGPMTKYETSFQAIIGGTSTMAVRRGLRIAARDPDVLCAVLCIDSPGGTVAGMTDLASDIRSLNAEKPCYAYISDMGCSAAYWAASQCSRVYANSGALVGCIGVMQVLRDTSKAYAQQGVVVHVITSDVPGDETMKGAGADGTPVTDDQLADFKRQANEQNDLFVADVAAGRNMTPENVRALADGRVHVGGKAKALGLVDEIASFDSAMQAIYQENYQMNSEQFKSFAASNPEDSAVKTLIAQGFKAGKAEARTEARTELAAMLAAFPAREKFAAEQFAKGHDVLAAKAELADVLGAELTKANEKLAEQTQAAAQAAARASASQDNPPVRIPPPGDPAQDRVATPEAAIASFEQAWSAHVTKGMSQDKAIAKVVIEQPDLHAAYVAAVQSGRKRSPRN